MTTAPSPARGCDVIERSRTDLGTTTSRVPLTRARIHGLAVPHGVERRGAGELSRSARFVGGQEPLLQRA